ncbi:unnamed protein product [Aphanomyces euteiches]|uniref:PHD-type domain-containing protein n=1 Tax=Aphanomyces euteiches TaxID=100861 RepID=A0A6G0X282_9STRA|nr:hypothetical protein Ae201684_009486 [Aphanomyces euteiches]KAH9070295.1 hypothetical protein Ae201684P_002657 [Aphanomyces euteiches]KAH9136205.1 hypothetical protein AeRB84_018536 [Aphanomyces euteiches]
MDWDDRRLLAKDITALSSADLQGVLLRCHVASPRTVAFQQDRPCKTNVWNIVKTSDWDGAGYVDLDQLDQSLLKELREYVNACFVPNPVQKDQCEICCGLWSTGRVLACGNSMCATRIHEECFGMVLRQDPSGPWFCPSCTYGSPLQCCLCLRDDGAIKPTSDGRWAHVICALGIPELTFRDVPTMEPIDGMADIDHARLRSVCNLCKRKGGAVATCEDENCGTAFHISCAAVAGLWIGAAADPNAVPPRPPNPFALYCEKHLPADRVIGAKRFISEEDLVMESMKLSAPEDADPRSADYTFVLDSAPYLLERHAWKKRIMTSSEGASAFEVTPRLYSHSRFPVKTLVPDMVHKVASSHGEIPPPAATIAFPPTMPKGSPPFPEGAALVGAIVEVYWKGFDNWYRAKVTDWDPTRRMNQVHYLGESRMEWIALRGQTCHILLMPADPPTKIKLVQCTYKNESQWRPKPKEFTSRD